MDWVRKTFDSIGVTQSPPGRELPAVQDRYLSHVLLCIDVSGSMGARDGRTTRLEAAKRGAERFVQEAVSSYYRVGLVLWDHDVSVHERLSQHPDRVLAQIKAAQVRGGTNICPALRLSIGELSPLANDRVIAIFGDGDLGNAAHALVLAREAAGKGIRIVVRGLGAGAHELEKVATEASAAPLNSGDDIEEGIASMANSLHRGLRARG